MGWLLLVSPPTGAKEVVQPQKTAYFGITNETTLPYIEIKHSDTKPEITKGILKDLAEALSKELKVKPVLVLLPQQRVAQDLVAGDLSLVCYLHESWLPNSSKIIEWSEPIATNTNLIVNLGKTRPKKVADLYGKQIGAIVNYSYKELDPYFEKNLIRRENAPNNESNIKKLLHGRIDYMILSNLEFEFHKKAHPKIVAYDLHLDSVQVKCALSQKSGIALRDLNKAIEILRSNGTLDKIFRP
ncbi:substrate-binding periplasmic protein [Bdellovibrio sp. HCB337]|uniref:substrate-binding periplasmic protein n=1 Tax=Bdellovibrio sp. HCB337 TaxID=3394358 RepID=UPI0039A431AC